MTDQTIRQSILEACHALGAAGLGNTIGGHVSVRVPGQDRYWTNVLDLCFEEMGENDLALIDFDGTVLEAQRPVSPGIDFHQCIYRRRPDIHSVVHTHGEWGTAQSAFCRPLRMYQNLCTYFHDRIAISPDDTIEAIGPALRDDTVAVMMPWHGAIVMAPTLADAAALMVTYEYAAKLDIRLSGTEAVPMPDDACRRVQGLLAQANYLDLTYALMVRRARHGAVGALRLPQPAVAA